MTYKDVKIPLKVHNKLTFFPDNIFLSNIVIQVNNLHLRFGHVNARSLLESISHKTIIANDKDKKGLNRIIKEDGCVACKLGKARRCDAIPLSKHKYTSKIPFARVYSDVAQVNNKYVSKNEHKYFISFKCAFTSFTKVYLMYKKSEVYEKVKCYVNWVNNQFYPNRVLEFFTDKGTEYFTDEMLDFFTNKGIEHHYTSGYSPASNGNAERINLIIFNDCRTMLHAGKVPPKFWPDAVIYCTYPRNFVYNPSLKDSPANMVGYRPINCKHLHIFGEKCAVTIPPYDGDKLQTRAHIGLYLGYDEDTFGHIIFIPDKAGDLSKGFFEYTRHVQFFPNNHLYMMSYQDTRNVSPMEFINYSDDQMNEDFQQDPIDEEISDQESLVSKPDDENREDIHSDNTSDYTSDNQEDLESDRSLNNVDDSEHPFEQVANENEHESETDIHTDNQSHADVISISSSDSDPNDESNDDSDYNPSDTSQEVETQPSTNIATSPSDTENDAEHELNITSSPTQEPSNDAPLMQISLDEDYDTDIEQSVDAGTREPEMSSHTAKACTEPEENIQEDEGKIEPLSARNFSSLLGRKRKRPVDIVVDPLPHKRQYIAPRVINHINIYLNNVTLVSIPKSYRDAINGPSSQRWIAAIKSELESHHTSNTWDPKPIIIDEQIFKTDYKKKTIPTHWVFAVKSDGKFKARLVARGDLQSIETYNVTFSPTLRPEIARLILSHCSSNHWYFQQIDIKTAYLNSLIDTTLYITPPLGVTTRKYPKGKRALYKLNKALYGLKQSGRLWHETILSLIHI